MKIARKTLLIITASLGILIILYSVVRHLAGIGLPPKLENYFMDVIIIAALGLFMYNRKLARDERLAREAAAQEAAGEPEEDENLPHWERRKKSGGD